MGANGGPYETPASRFCFSRCFSDRIPRCHVCSTRTWRGDEAVLLISNNTNATWTGTVWVMQGYNETWQGQWAVNGQNFTGMGGVPVTLPLKGMVKLRLTGDNTTRAGYLEVKPGVGYRDTDVAISYFYEVRVKGVLQDNAGSPQSAYGNRFFFAVEKSSAIDTGIAWCPSPPYISNLFPLYSPCMTRKVSSRGSSHICSWSIKRGLSVRSSPISRVPSRATSRLTRRTTSMWRCCGWKGIPPDSSLRAHPPTVFLRRHVWHTHETLRTMGPAWQAGTWGRVRSCRPLARRPSCTGLQAMLPASSFLDPTGQKWYTLASPHDKPA